MAPAHRTMMFPNGLVTALSRVVGILNVGLCCRLHVFDSLTGLRVDFESQVDDLLVFTVVSLKCGGIHGDELCIGFL